MIPVTKKYPVYEFAAEFKQFSLVFLCLIVCESWRVYGANLHFLFNIPKRSMTCLLWFQGKVSTYKVYTHVVYTYVLLPHSP